MLIKQYSSIFLGLRLVITSKQIGEHLYVHTMQITFLGYNLITTVWKTGSDADNIRDYSYFNVTKCNHDNNKVAGFVNDNQPE